MQFGGTPMVPSPSSTGDSASGLQVSASTEGLSPYINEDSTRKVLANRPSSMFSPHPNIGTQHGMLQNSANGQMSNGAAANGGNHYASNGQHQQQQQQAQILQQQQQQHTMNNGTSTNGHSAANGTSNTSQLIYPALHLQPLNDTFAPKQISLTPPGPQNKIKIGRQTNQKTLPQPSNGFFDSKVLSRMHAEVWSQDGKVFIKDVKSSNGTFINGSRLSPEGQESDIFELHTDDIVEFGIDIVGEDNKTTLHHKVACRAFLVMTAEEALGLRHDFAALYRGGIAGSTLTHHSVGPGAEGGLRRSKVGGGGGNGYGGLGNGGAMMSFDHILHKLQAELQKSRDTAGELGNLNTAMHDIGETLGGGLPPMQHPPYQHMVPSANGEREGQKQGGDQGQADAAKASSDTLVKVLEEQVQETQRALNAHVDRLAGLEARLEEHDGVKMDVNLMRSQVEEARRELAEALRMRSLAGQSGIMRNGRGVEINKAHRDHSEEDDFDDGVSMASMDTVVQGDARGSDLGNAPIGVDEVESADIAGRFSHQDDDMLDDAETLQRLKNHIGPLAPADGVAAPFGREVESDDATVRRNEELSKRLQTIESQLERALELGKVLANQHAEASEAVKRLEEKVKSLEGDRETREEAAPVPSSQGSGEAILGAAAGVGAVGAAGASGSILAILEAKWGKWRDAFESDFEVERQGFRQEREEIKRVVKMWDGLNSDIEDVLDVDVGEENKIDPVREDTQPSPPTATKQLSTTAKKRKKRRAAAAAAAMSASSAPSTSNVGLSSSPRSVQDSTARINRELRSLLYTDKFNFLVREEHFSAEDTLGTATDREETPTQSDIGTGRMDEDGEMSSRSTRGLSHLTSDAKRSPPGSRNGRSGQGVRAGLDGPNALPMLGVAGVMVLGMTAWVLSGGKSFHSSGSPGSF